MPINANDPRVKRTSQLLMQSFMELLIEKKNIYSISVQDIAARATVNRATFYAHFEDKFAFLECWMREKFQKKLKEALPDSSISNMSSLRTLLLAVLIFLPVLGSTWLQRTVNLNRCLKSRCKRTLSTPIRMVE